MSAIVSPVVDDWAWEEPAALMAPYGARAWRYTVRVVFAGGPACWADVVVRVTIEQRGIVLGSALEPAEGAWCGPGLAGFDTRQILAVASETICPLVYEDALSLARGDDDDGDEGVCSSCAGTGIGQFGDPDTSRCSSCRGSGSTHARTEREYYGDD